MNSAAAGALPIAALRLPEPTLQTLAALGVERIEQLQALPRAELPRIDPLVLRRLDQMFGRVPEPIVACKVRPEVQARCSFEYATDRRAFLDHAFDHLLPRIVANLREQGRGAKHLECWFFHESAAPSRIDVRLFRPTQEIDHLRKLLDARLERLALPEPVCGICLRAPLIEPLTPRQYDLFEEPPHEEELATLIDRLVSRLGHDVVTFATLVADPQPEYACRFDPALNERRVKDEKRVKQRKRQNVKEEGLLFDTQNSVLGTQYSVLSTQYSMRPTSLVRPERLISLAWSTDGLPVRFRHGGREHAVARSWGPERIETGWWRGDDVRRDYYIVETDVGARWWIFRRPDGQWFVQGCFD